MTLFAALPPVTMAQDWPMRRHDSQRLAYQSAGVDIDVPGVLGTITLGGALGGRDWLVDDADSDGSDEVYLLGGGRLMCWRGDGVLLWATSPLNFNQIIAVDDLDGDGRREVFVSGGQVAPTAFDALTGAQLWQAPLPPGQFVGDVIPVDVDGDGRRELMVADWGGPAAGSGTARVYHFPDGLGGTVSTTPLDTSAHGYWFGLGLAAGDLAGDGHVQLVTASNDRIVAYDLATGVPTFTSPPLGAFPFGKVKVNVADVDGDGRDEVVVASDNAGGSWPAAKRLMLLEVESGALTTRWEFLVDPVTGEHRFIRDNVATLRSGDIPSIVTTVFDPDSSHWRTLVFAGTAPDATALVALEDRVVVALADVDGDGISELITQDAPSANVPDFGTIRALNLQVDLTWTEKWSVDDAMLSMAAVAWRSSSSEPVRPSGGLLFQIDSDGDRRADRLAYRGVDSAHFTAPRGIALSSARTPISGADRTWIAMSDGHLARLDLGLSVTNDVAPADGHPDLRIGTYEAPPVVSALSATGVILATTDATDAPTAYLLSAGPEPLWTAADHVATPRPTMTWLPGTEPQLAYPAREADGTMSLVLRDGRTGAERARYSYGPSVSTNILNDLLPLRGADGGVTSLVTGLLDVRSGAVSYVATNPASGAMMPLDLGRVLVSGEYPTTAHDVDGDGNEDVLVLQIAHLLVASGSDGSLLTEHDNPRFGGMMTYVDLDGDGTLDVLHQGAFGINGGSPGFGARRLLTDLTTEVWSVDQADFQHPAGLAPALGGGFHLGLTRSRDAWASAVDAAGSTLAISVPAGGAFYPDRASAEAAGLVLGIPTSAAGIASATPGRSATFVFGSTDGYLYAMAAEDGGFSWSMPFRAAVGEPIASDVLGDETSEIVVPAGDGNIYIVGPARLDAPAEVFDNDGTTAAGSSSADIDELPASSKVGGDWTAVPDATGYEYQIVRDDDLVVVPWIDVGPTTEVFFDTLSLEVGLRYLGVVRAYDRSGSELRVSPEVRSDGFVVIDEDGPSVALIATPDTIWRVGDGSPSETHVHMIAADSVGLQSYELRVQAANGTLARTALASGPASGIERIVDVTWAGNDDSGASVSAGLYAIVGVSTDLGGRSAEARVSVRVCTLDAPASLGCSEAGDAGPTDAGADAGGTLAGGGGCGCRVGGQTAPAPLGLIGLMMAGLFFLRRRWR